MQREQILNTVIKRVKQFCKFEDVWTEDLLTELGLDSLDTVSLFSSIAQDLQIYSYSAECINFKSINDLIDVFVYLKNGVHNEA